MATVVPAIIPKSFDGLKEDLSRVHSLVERVQIDVIDGKFGPEASWPYLHAEKTKKEGSNTEVFGRLVNEEGGLPFQDELTYEIDMMVEKPEESALDWVQAGARAIIIHHGSTKIFETILGELRDVGVEVGLAVKPSTLDLDFHPLVEKVDFVQVMGNDKIGFHGVSLDPHVYEKVANLRSSFPDVTISVDIGVDRDTAPKLVEAGVNRLVSGSSIFGADNIREAIAHFSSL